MSRMIPKACPPSLDEMRNVIKAPTEMTEIDAHINDQAFADTALAIFDGWVAKRHSQNMSRHDILFEPIQLGPVTAKNRFYAVPHATGHGWQQPNGAIALRAMKAEGGWGVVSTQMTEIAPDSDMANHPLERIWSDDDLVTHTAQAEAIKRHGALAAI